MITINEIQSITEYCIKLLSYTEYLRRDEVTQGAYEIADEIFKSIRKLYIASMMYNKKLICISGLQGAGKTTLMKSFYGINGDYLDPTHGRGERVPVLITENKDITVPELYAIRIDKNANGDYEQHSVKLAAEDYLSASKGEDSKIMYLELFVPYKHTFNEGLSFMLLPGFEKKNDYWNTLIEFSVNSSDAAVFVFNETSFSNADNDSYLNKIEKKFGNNLVYAISHSDASPDNNAEVKQTCIQTLSIPANEADRVVCVGAYTDEEKNLAWCNKFKDALEKYAYRETQQFEQNSKYLYKEILNIKDAMYKILNILNNDSSAELNDHHNDTLLKAFDKAVSKKRKEFEAALSDEFETAKSESGKNLESLFSARSKLGTAKRLFFGSSVKEQYTDTRKMVEKALVGEGDRFLPNEYLGKALQNSVELLENPQNQTSNRRLIDAEENNNKLELTEGEKTQATVNDIRALLVDNGQNRVNIALQNTNPKKLLGAVADLSTYYYYSEMLYLNNEAKVQSLSYYELSNTLLNPKSVVAGGESSKKFVASMAGVMGVDLIGDGSLNLVSQIATALSISVPVAGAIAAAVIGAGAGAVVMKDINRMQREDFQSARLTVNSVYDSFKVDALKKYDSYMERIRDRIEDNITELSGDTKKIVVEHNAKIQINNALNLLDKITDRYTGGIYGLESALS